MITITETGDHHQPEWLITFTGIRNGPVGTVSSRFYRWCRAGVWDRILSALQAEADARGEIDWDLHVVDATIIRAHQHAAGARRTGAVGG
jgi:transposase